ncbi:copper homeostasis protein CutC [Hymenobacter metallilatus]|uniref:PF03932 family protein CutC n=1 Tax=Hymenobacter metallilatus TaxID=2493666 RepID=A0A428JGM5_9BACT|nr:copper homeostasis protein CutC [Hymenobacter metallilatus]RSK31666.1 copper homeostasis protein CutC [Hymenobacter metallilatus]
MRPRVLEICAGSVQSALAAEAGGAHRIELCQQLEQGGTTPSHGTLARVLARVRLPVFVLIRPRPGNFCYDAEELAVMAADIRHSRALGCAGIVLGALDEAGGVDRAGCRMLMEAAGHLPVTFHRAFDACPNQAQALEDVISLGCHRVLTAGGQPTAPQGLPQLAALVRQAAGRISVMPGAGLTPTTIQAVARYTGAHELHASAKKMVLGLSAARASEFDVPRWETDADSVRELVARLGADSGETAGA